ncbi:hypothetical protein ACI2KR_27355 [Pseudomonas luteola]
MYVPLDASEARLFEAAKRLKKGLICFGGSVCSGKSSSAHRLLDVITEGKPAGIDSVLASGELRSLMDASVMSLSLDSNVLFLTSIYASSVESIPSRFDDLYFGADSWKNVEEGSILICQKLLNAVDPEQSLSLGACERLNRGNHRFDDLISSLSASADGRSLEKVRFSTIEALAPADQAIVPDGLSRIGKGKYKFVAREMIVVDSELKSLLVENKINEAEKYIAQHKGQSIREHAFQALLEGKIDPTEFSFAFD